MNSQPLARWIYTRLPEHSGANRYDRKWKRGKRSARFYVGDITNKEIRGFNLWLDSKNGIAAHIVWPASRISYSSNFIGDNESFDQVKKQENWKPNKSWYFRRPSKSNCHKFQWRLGYAYGIFGPKCGWSFNYYDGRIELWIRKHAK